MKAWKKYGWIFLLSLGFVIAPNIELPWGIWDFSWEAGFCVGIFITLCWKSRK